MCAPKNKKKKKSLKIKIYIETPVISKQVLKLLSGKEYIPISISIVNANQVSS